MAVNQSNSVQLDNQVQLTDALLKAFNKVVEQKQLEQKTTSVIEGKVIEVLDSGVGYYKIEYLGGTFNAYSSNKNYKYNIDDRVYIIIPDGDMYNTKIILSTVGIENSSIIKLSNQDIFYIPFGDNLLFLDYTEEYPYELSSFRDEPLPEGAAEKFTLNDAIVFEGFQDALKYTRTFDFTYKIKTEIEKHRRINGNYGLYLSIPIIQDNVEKDIEITFDTHRMLGDPYNFIEYAPQHYYFTFPDNAEVDTNRKIDLKGFVSNFPKEEGATEVNDLKFANIEIIPVKALSSTDKAGYNLKLTATQGSFFAKAVNSLSEEKDLVPNLYYDGQLINLNANLRDDLYKAYWFIQDYSVNINSDYYHPLGGTGWRILNTKKDSVQSNDEDPYITNNYKYRIYRKEVHFELNYKCVLVINNSDTLSDTIMIKNLASNIKLDLRSATGSNKYIENVGNVDLIMEYFEDGITNTEQEVGTYPFYNYNFYWQRYDNAGSVQPNFNPTISPVEKTETGSVESSIDFPTHIIDKVNTFTCTVVLERIDESNETVEDPDHAGQYIHPKISEEYVIGTRSITIQTSQEVTMSVILENDNPFFKYDWSGNSPLLGTYDGPAISKNELIKPINILAVKDENGREFTEQELNTLTVKWLVPSYKTKSNGEDDTRLRTLIEISNRDGSWKNEVFNNKKYFVKEGEFQDLKTLTYGIKNLYDKTLTDNTVILQIKLKDKEITRYIDFTFTKDGQSGTNGTNYAAEIVYHEDQKAYGASDSDTGLPNKCQLVYIAEFEPKENPQEGEPQYEALDPWFLYNPAWVGDSSITDNELGLIHFSEKDIDLTYTIESSAEGGSSTSKTVTIRGLKESDNLFDVIVYCNGQEVVYGDTFAKDATWSIFDYDYDYSGILSPIEANTEPDGACKINILSAPKMPSGSAAATWKDVWFYEDTSTSGEKTSWTICCTLQVKVRAQKRASSNPEVSDSSLNSNFYIYAYYPIEVTYVSKGDTIYNYIPTLQGGFSDVIYASQGLQPEYDNSQPFEMLGVERIEEIGDQLLKDGNYNYGDASICEYRWSLSNNLSCPQKLEDLIYEKTITVDPTPQLSDECRKNFIKVQVDFNDSLINNLATEKNQIDEEVALLNSSKEQYDIIENNKSIFNDDFDTIYNYIQTKISNELAVINSSKDIEEDLKIIRKSFQDIQQTIGKYRPQVKQEFFDRYEALSSATNTYLQAINDEISLLKDLKQISSNQVEVILNLIKALQQDRPSNQRYVYDENEVQNENQLLSFRVDADTDFLGFIDEKFKYHQTLVGSLAYAKNFDSLIMDSQTFEGMAETFEDIRQKILIYLESDKWTSLLNLEVSNDDLNEIKINFFKLYESLQTAYQQKIRFNPNLDNPYISITECIEKMKSLIDPYKNYNVETKITNADAEVEEKIALADSLQKIFDLVVQTENDYRIIHAKPIVMLNNRYELGYINDWDGNKLKIDNDGGYVISPKFAAGRKEDDNSFTGMVMGTYKQAENNGVQRVGIFGKHRGEETLFLDALTGSAVFGLKGEGQIYIDSRPQYGGCIFSGNYYTKYDDETGAPDRDSHTNKGMLINLKDSYIHFGSGGGAFIYSGSHNSHESQEDGFRLDAFGLSIGKGLKVKETGEFYFGYGTENSLPGDRKYLHFNPNATDASGKQGVFKIGEDVEVIASKVKVDALQGETLQGVTISGGIIKTTDESVVINDTQGLVVNKGNINIKNGSINLGNGVFQVTNEGALTAKSATVQGTLTAGLDSWIGNWRVAKNGRLRGYKTIGENEKKTNIVLCPDDGTIGFYTGHVYEDGTRDFAFIGAMTSVDNNALGFFAHHDKGQGQGKCNVYANTFVADKNMICSVDGDGYIYIGCKPSSPKTNAIRINTTTIQRYKNSHWITVWNIPS